jgi:hypothetical protein
MWVGRVLSRQSFFNHHPHFIIRQTVVPSERGQRSPNYEMVKWRTLLIVSKIWAYSSIKQDHFFTKCGGFSLRRPGKVVVKGFYRNRRVKRRETKHFLWSHGFPRIVAPLSNFKFGNMILPILPGKSIYIVRVVVVMQVRMSNLHAPHASLAPWVRKRLCPFHVRKTHAILNRRGHQWHAAAAACH